MVINLRSNSCALVDVNFLDYPTDDQKTKVSKQIIDKEPYTKVFEFFILDINTAQIQLYAYFLKESC